MAIAPAGIGMVLSLPERSATVQAPARRAAPLSGPADSVSLSGTARALWAAALRGEGPALQLSPTQLRAMVTADDGQAAFVPAVPQSTPEAHLALRRLLLRADASPAQVGTADGPRVGTAVEHSSIPAEEDHVR